VADREKYAIVNIAAASLTPLMPISQLMDAPGPRIRPAIAVVSETEFLILSWNGASTMGLFLTGEGDPVRGTLEWPAHPLSICLSAYLFHIECRSHRKVFRP
jgi:vacuolar protein sorting-associated protein 3